MFFTWLQTVFFKILLIWLGTVVEAFPYTNIPKNSVTFSWQCLGKGACFWLHVTETQFKMKGTKTKMKGTKWQKSEVGQISGLVEPVIEECHSGLRFFFYYPSLLCHLQCQLHPIAGFPFRIAAGWDKGFILSFRYRRMVAGFRQLSQKYNKNLILN